MKHGFTLIDLLISLAIGAILSSLLFGSLYQTNRLTKKINAIVAHNEQIGLIARIEDDLIGCCLPPEKISDSSEKELPPIVAFYSTNENDQCKMVSFISTSSFGNAFTHLTRTLLPLPVRIAYLIEPEQAPKPLHAQSINSFQLIRYETSNLDVNTDAIFEDRAKGIICINRIASITVLYEFEPINQENKKEAPPIESRSTWTPSTDKEATPELPPLPLTVKITLELWDNNYEKITKLNLVISLPTAPALNQPKSSKL
ncbi:MAG: prepilin-type N-terminal cleavage/methylation domain-containing protein [Candidatus Babeliales bacterium]